MSVKSPSEELQGEHAALIRDAKSIQDTLRGVGAGGGAAGTEIGGTLAEGVGGLRRGLLLHFRREEAGFFAVARRLVAERSPQADAINRFFAEESDDDMSAHAALESRANDAVALLHQAQESAKLDEPLLRRLRTLLSTSISLLERHVEKEEQLIFPMIERSLDRLEIEEVRKRMSDLTSAQDLAASSGDDVRPLDMGPQ
jgi:hypothetical protein